MLLTIAHQNHQNRVYTTLAHLWAGWMCPTGLGRRALPSWAQAHSVLLIHGVLVLDHGVESWRAFSWHHVGEKVCDKGREGREMDAVAGESEGCGGCHVIDVELHVALALQVVDHRPSLSQPDLGWGKESLQPMVEAYWSAGDGRHHVACAVAELGVLPEVTDVAGVGVLEVVVLLLVDLVE